MLLWKHFGMFSSLNSDTRMTPSKRPVYNWAAWLEPSRMKVSVLVISVQLTQTWLQWFLLTTTCHDGGFPKQLGVISHIENWQTRVCTKTWKLCSCAVCKHAHKDAHALVTEHEWCSNVRLDPSQGTYRATIQTSRAPVSKVTWKTLQRKEECLHQSWNIERACFTGFFFPLSAL